MGTPRPAVPFQRQVENFEKGEGGLRHLGQPSCQLEGGTLGGVLEATLLRK